MSENPLTDRGGGDTVAVIVVLLLFVNYLSTMNLKPLGDRLIVEPVSVDEVTKAGIILPDTIDKEKPEKGTVLAIGPGRLLESGARLPLEVKVGDSVVFKKYSPDEVKIDDKTYLILSESDIMAVIE